jgi:NAD(P)-dependent dehydrogenase (short-subunit alcohol dehydrogenase family)
MSDLLKGRVILLTGGAHGIGRECARIYAEDGAQVVVADINEAGAQETVASLVVPGLAVACDVTNDEQVRAAVERAVQVFGRLDAVHNNTGMSSPSKPLHTTTDEEWRRLFEINLRSVLLTTRHAYGPLKASRGSILNTASMVGQIGQDNHAAYVATKGGMIALTKAMALDYAPDGIRVNAVCPAGVWTDMLKKWAGEQPQPERVLGYLNDIHALGYCPDADVVAHASAFLLSEQARFITGCILPVSGGAELGYRRIQ